MQPTNLNDYYAPNQYKADQSDIVKFGAFGLIGLAASLTIQLKPDFNLNSIGRIATTSGFIFCGFKIIQVQRRLDAQARYKEMIESAAVDKVGQRLGHEMAVQTFIDEADCQRYLPQQVQPQPQPQYQQMQPHTQLEEQEEYYQPQQQAYQPDGEYDLDYSYEQPPDNTKYFDWKLFDTKPDKYPHLAIVGGTGDGKSFTAENVCRELSGLLIVCHPHKKPTDYLGVKSIHSGGRNYGNWKEDKEVNFKLLLEPNGQNISFASVIKTLYAEMDRRFKLYSQGVENYPIVNAILDEFNTSVAEVPEAMEVTKKMIREARKVRIRLILLLQDDSVKSLKIQGEGSIRKCFRYVRLGEFAQTHAKRLKNSALLQWVNQQQYPILVGDSAAVIHPKQKQREPQSQPTEEPDQATVIDVEVREVAEDFGHPSALTVRKTQPINSQISVTLKTLDDAIALVAYKLQNPDSPPLHEGKTPGQIELLFKALQHHKQNQTDTIYHLFGVVRSGTSTKYRQARDLYYQLLLETADTIAEILPKITAITFPDLRLLPADAGVYFVFDSDYICYYIGSSNKILFRWNSPNFGKHQKHDRVKAVAHNKTVKIGWVLTSDYERIEADLIAKFKPAWNGC